MATQTCTNEQWKTLIESKIAAVGKDTSTIEFLSRNLTVPELANVIDHTLLKPESTAQKIDLLCNEAKQYGFKSCCVNGAWVDRVVQNLDGCESVVACVIGFPLGAMDSAVKVVEAHTAIAKGARELDMVIHVGALKSGLYSDVFDDIASISGACSSSSSPRVILKCIVETSLLTCAEIIAACYIAAEAGADFVKTCTGFSGGKATVEHVRLMYRTVAYKNGAVKVKASAGVRDLGDALALTKAGASRIGTSAGVAIIREAVSSFE